MIRVKELEWKFFDLPHEYGRGAWDANTPWDTYVIMDCSEQFTGDNLYYCRKISSQFPTIEAAQAAAQADYERRILSTLKPEGEQISGEAGCDCGSTEPFQVHSWRCAARNPSSEQISGDAVERVTDAMVERALRAMNIDDFNPVMMSMMRAALEAAMAFRIGQLRERGANHDR